MICRKRNGKERQSWNGSENGKKHNYVHMMRIMDSTGKRTVVYTAKYIGKNGEKALAALDAAIRSFRSTR